MARVCRTLMKLDFDFSSLSFLFFCVGNENMVCKRWKVVAWWLGYEWRRSVLSWWVFWVLLKLCHVKPYNFLFGFKIILNKIIEWDVKWCGSTQSYPNFVWWFKNFKKRGFVFIVSHIIVMCVPLTFSCNNCFDPRFILFSSYYY